MGLLGGLGSLIVFSSAVASLKLALDQTDYGYFGTSPLIIISVAGLFMVLVACRWISSSASNAWIFRSILIAAVLLTPPLFFLFTTTSSWILTVPSALLIWMSYRSVASKLNERFFSTTSYIYAVAAGLSVAGIYLDLLVLIELSFLVLLLAFVFQAVSFFLISARSRVFRMALKAVAVLALIVVSGISAYAIEHNAAPAPKVKPPPAIYIELAGFVTGARGSSTPEVFLVVRNVGAGSVILASLSVSGYPSNQGFSGSLTASVPTVEPTGGSQSSTAVNSTDGAGIWRLSANKTGSITSFPVSLKEGEAVGLLLSVMNGQSVGASTQIVSGDFLQIRVTASQGAFGDARFTVP